MPISIDHVLNDRARTHSRTKGARVEHETQLVEEVSDWFPCRIAPATGEEIMRAQRREVEMTHQFIARMLDFNNLPVVIRIEDQLEIEVGPAPYFNNLEGAGTYEIVELFKPRNITPEYLLWVATVKLLKEF